MLAASRKLLQKLSHPDIMFFTTMWMMILVVLGTVAQKYIGLYQAQKLFFSSWVLWSGFIPLPGGLATMALITVSLTLKLIFNSPWNLAKSGIIVTHIGALLLLYGGLLTSVNSTEGSMLLYEGETSNYVADYHERELVVYPEGSDDKLFAVPFEKLKPNVDIVVPTLPLTIEILQACRNCDVFNRSESSLRIYGEELRGKAKELDIKPTALALEDEVNRSGAQFRVHGADGDSNGIYFSMDFIDIAPRILVGGKAYTIIIQKKRTYLPFSLTLQKFERHYHAGTDVAQSYKSQVILRDGNAEWNSLVQMNEPLRYRGYTFYQASFIDEGARQATVLAVVKNAGRIFPYISGSVMCIGLLMIMVMKVPALVRSIMAKRKILPMMIFALCAMLGLMSPAQANVRVDHTAFESIPILDQGRVKPLLSFAENSLQLIRGASSLPDMSASAWLAELIFDPESAYDRRVFNIADPRVTDTIGIERRTPHLYSFRELGAGVAKHYSTIRDLLEKPESQRVDSQKSLVALYNKLQIYGEISRALSLIAPNFMITSPKLAKALGVPAYTPLTYNALQEHRGALVKLGEQALLPASKGGKAMALSDLDRDVIVLLQQMEMTSRDQQGTVFRVVPPQWEAKQDNALWYTLWELPTAGQGSPDSIKLMEQWQAALVAYRAGRDSVAALDAYRDAEFAKAAQEILKQSLTMAQGRVSEGKLKLEVEYKRWDPLRFSMIAYGIALGLVLLSFMVWGYKHARAVIWSGAWFYVLGFALHGLSLLLRMLIMGRPPVTNLYASIIFVGFIIALIGLLYEYRMRNFIGLIVGAIAGVVLQFIGLKYDTEGDTMGLLVAVLDTNFWLSTHVVCITIGYAFCLLGAIMAHIYLVLRIARPAALVRCAELAKNIRGIAYLSLFFAALGTILGGIWADQSWGRFWGWDPKENGALLICLWLLMLTHGRMGGRLGELGFIVGMALLNVVVAMSWFGVNLLGVGLHSYGFTQGAVTGLISFSVAEIAFVIICYATIKRRALTTAT